VFAGDFDPFHTGKEPEHKATYTTPDPSVPARSKRKNIDPGARSTKLDPNIAELVPRKSNLTRPNRVADTSPNTVVVKEVIAMPPKRSRKSRKGKSRKGRKGTRKRKSSKRFTRKKTRKMFRKSTGPMHGPIPLNKFNHKLGAFNSVSHVKNGMRVKGQDYLGSLALATTDIAGQVYLTVDVNPRNIFATRLRVESSLYEGFFCDSFSVHVQTTYSMSTAGALSGYFESDPTDQFGGSGSDQRERIAFGHQGHMEQVVENGFWTMQKPDKKKSYWVDRGDDNTSERQYIQSRFRLFCATPVGTNGTIHVWISYNFKLYQSKWDRTCIEPGGWTDSTMQPTSTTWGTVAPVPTPGSLWDISWVSGSGYLTGSLDGFNYLFTLFTVSGAVALTTVVINHYYALTEYSIRNGLGTSMTAVNAGSSYLSGTTAGVAWRISRRSSSQTQYKAMNTFGIAPTIAYSSAPSTSKTWVTPFFAEDPATFPVVGIPHIDMEVLAVCRALGCINMPKNLSEEQEAKIKRYLASDESKWCSLHTGAGGKFSPSGESKESRTSRGPGVRYITEDNGDEKIPSTRTPAQTWDSKTDLRVSEDSKREAVTNDGAQLVYPEGRKFKSLPEVDYQSIWKAVNRQVQRGRDEKSEADWSDVDQVQEDMDIHFAELKAVFQLNPERRELAAKQKGGWAVLAERAKLNVYRPVNYSEQNAVWNTFESLYNFAPPEVQREYLDNVRKHELASAKPAPVEEKKAAQV